MNRDLEIETAIALIKKGFGKQLLEVARRCTVPLFWASPNQDGTYRINNGTAFFLNTGTKTFCVTANHVYKGYINAKVDNPKIFCQLCDLTFKPENRLIDSCEKLDIATFEVTEKEVTDNGKRFFEGHQSTWPPKPPEVGKGIFFIGYPGHERIVTDPNRLNFGIFSGLCVAHYVSDNHISIHFDREVEGVEELTTMPKSYLLGGISGAPVFSLVQNHINYWRLAGVVYEAREELGVVYVRRADFILPDGKIRKDLF